jgi:hypothetical protein
MGKFFGASAGCTRGTRAGLDQLTARDARGYQQIGTFIRLSAGYRSILFSKSGAVTKNREDLATKTPSDQHPRCPSSAAFRKLKLKFLDERRGRSIRLYQCQCGERIWED